MESAYRRNSDGNPFVPFTGHAGFGGHQGQISDRGRQVQLE